MRNEARFNRFWYEGEPSPWWTRPLAFVFSIVVRVRLALFRRGILRKFHPGVPVIVIGNLVAGGAGKTPLAVALVDELQRRGYRVGVISRGYGAQPGKSPLLVDTASSAALVGDEPLLIARRTGAPVCVHARRVLAARAILESRKLDLLLCDDGLQHYALSRDMELVVIDGARGLGNGRMLPAGPLREPAASLARATHVMINGALGNKARATLPEGTVGKAATMTLAPVAIVNLRTGERRAPGALAGSDVVAVAGIGNPQRFFETLGDLGYTAECCAFPDHHAFEAADIAFANGRPVLMTEKDAVKCAVFAAENWWYLETAAILEPEFIRTFIAQVAALIGRGPAEKPK